MPAKEEHFPDCRSGNQKCRNLQNLTECVLNTTMIMNEMFKFGIRLKSLDTNKDLECLQVIV